MLEWHLGVKGLMAGLLKSQLWNIGVSNGPWEYWPMESKSQEVQESRRIFLRKKLLNVPHTKFVKMSYNYFSIRISLFSSTLL